MRKEYSIWFDGICNECGYPVIEMSDDSKCKDYMNMCLNRECKEHIWHRIYDDEFLDYYIHNKSDFKLNPLTFKINRGTICQ